MWNKNEVKDAVDEFAGRAHNAMSYEHPSKSSTVFMAGLFAGAAIGAGIGLLFAPRKGSELREQVSGAAVNAGKTMSDAAMNAGKTVSQTVEDLSQRGRTLYSRARESASRAAEEVENIASAPGA